MPFLCGLQACMVSLFMTSSFPAGLLPASLRLSLICQLRLPGSLDPFGWMGDQAPSHQQGAVDDDDDGDDDDDDDDC